MQNIGKNMKQNMGENMEQNTGKWLSWRRSGIGASDAPIIMGVSPWKSIDDLYLDKISQEKPKEFTNYVMERGKKIEPIVRSKYELKNLIDMPAIVCQHEDHEWLRASMDGANLELMKGIEIKVPGKKDHDCASEGKIPEKYFPQIQHQFLVTGFKEIDYVSYYVHHRSGDFYSGDYVCVACYPDIAYIAEYLKKAKWFWFDCVQKRISPCENPM